MVFLGGSPNGTGLKGSNCLPCSSWHATIQCDGLRLPRIQEQYKKAPEPKALIILEGSAHAQYLFQTDQAERAMRTLILSSFPRSRITPNREAAPFS